MTRSSLLALLVLLSACERELSFGTLRGGDGGGPDTPNRDGAGEPDASSSLGFCSGRGPLVDSGDGFDGACDGAARGYHFALCSCGAFTNEQATEVDGYDSRRGPYLPGEASGSLGTNGALFARALTLGGSLIVAGSEGAPLSAELRVEGHLGVRGQLQGPHLVRVGRDARVAGDVRLAGLLVGGSLSLAPESAYEVADGPTPLREALAIAPPCRCDGALDVEALTRAARDDNDDATIALDPSGGLETLEATTLELPCGRYYVDDVYAARELTLRVRGRVALYVGQRIVVDPAGALEITLDDGAELDLFVARGMSASGPVRIGSPAHPDRARLYFGGGVPSGTGDNVYFGGESTVAATLYAPHSELVTKAPFALFGSALVASVAASGQLDLHQDRALARDACEEATCEEASACGAFMRCDDARCLP